MPPPQRLINVSVPVSYTHLHEANVEQKKNVLISPASALFALGMTGNGADGKTLQEFEQVLGNGLSMEELSESYGTLLRQYEKIPSDKLVVADSISVSYTHLVRNTQSDKGQGRFLQDEEGNVRRRRHNNGTHNVRQNLLEHDV